MPGNRSTLLLPIAFLAFVSLGLPDAVLGVAWPSMRREIGLPLSALGWLLAANLAGTLVSSFWSGSVVARLGVGRVLLWSSLAMSASSLGFSLAPSWGLILVCGVIAGLGSGAVDAGVNAYAAGRFSAAQVTWLHACYGIGATLGPLEMSAVLSSGLPWRWGYGLLCAALGAMALAFLATLGLWRAGPSQTEPIRSAGILETLRHGPVWGGLALFFLYTGLEAAVGQWAYSVLAEGRGLSPALAGALTSLYWGCLTLGRIAFGAAAQRLSTRRLLRLSLGFAPAGAALLGLGSGAWGSGLGLALLGLAFAPVFPLLMASTPERLGPAFAPQAIGLQVTSAYLGAAAVPGAAGMLAKGQGLESLGPFLAVLAFGLAVLERCVAGATPSSARRC
jgi:fucose permease